MYLFTVLAYLLIDKAIFSHGYTNEKCCASDEYLKKVDIRYECSQNPSKRLDVLTNATSFLEKGIDGECVDITTEFSVFKVTAGQISGVRTFEEPHFPKCCPLNHFYNTTLHSCEERGNVTHSFIKEILVKVGLPDCKVIVDYELNEEIDLYGSVIDIKRHSEYCVDENEKGRLTMRECRKDTEICTHIKCVKKCCPDGQSFVNGPHCYDTYTHGLNLKASPVIENPKDPFAIISNHTCKKIYLMSEKRYIFNLTKHGEFVYWKNFTNSFIREGINDPYSYCYEHSKGKMNGFYFFKCFTPPKPVKKKFKYTLVPKIMSCVFLMLTILIYIILNETRTVFGKILVNYCVGILGLFSFLVYAHKDLTPSDIICKLIGYLLIFLSTVSFAWLNIMCCDIWWTFGSTKQSVGVHQRRKDLKKLLFYLLYGWGMPTVLTLTIFLLTRYPVLPYAIQPFATVASINGMVVSGLCAISSSEEENFRSLEASRVLNRRRGKQPGTTISRDGNYAQMLFLRFPHLVIQLVNTVLFFKTILYCLKIKNEINKINDTTKNEKRSSFNKDKERLLLILKLSIIMGVTYVFDVMSAFVDMSELGTVPRYIEVIWDYINCLQGVFIFIIFICKKKIYYDFLKKLRLARDKKSFSKQSFTSSTRMSMLNSNRRSTTRS